MFDELAPLSKTTERWVNTDSVLLGDRVTVRSVVFVRGFADGTRHFFRDGVL